MNPEQMWYYGQNGQQMGPVPTSQLIGMVQGGQVDRSSYVFTQGMATWTPITAVQPFSMYFGTAAPPPPMPKAPPAAADVIDYTITGEEMQLVEVTLDPGEACISEAGALLWMEADISMNQIFGDGRKEQDESLTDKALAAGKRVLTGESIALTQFRNDSTSQRRVVAFASPYPGKIIPMDLAQLGGKMICQKDAFLAAAHGIRVGIEFNRNIGAGLFGGEGFILQKLEGEGLAFVHAGGCIVPKTLAAGETIRLDTGCLVAFQPTVGYDIKFVGGIANAVLGGEGLFLATLTGPGMVWVQSLPFSRLAGRIYAAAPQLGGRDMGEGSILGGAGDLAMGSGNVDASSLITGIARMMKK